MMYISKYNTAFQFLIIIHQHLNFLSVVKVENADN